MVPSSCFSAVGVQELHSMDGSTRASAAGGDEEEDGGKGSLDRCVVVWRSA